MNVPEVAVQRMKLDDKRIDTLIEGIRHVAQAEDPLNKTLHRTELAQVCRHSLAYPWRTCRSNCTLRTLPRVQDVMHGGVALQVHANGKEYQFLHTKSFEKDYVAEFGSGEGDGAVGSGALHL